VTCIALMSGHIASPTAIPPFPLRLTFLDGSDAVASPSLHHCRVSEYLIGLPLALLFRSVFAKDSRVPLDAILRIADAAKWNARIEVLPERRRPYQVSDCNGDF
jgi:hypothetical protein